MAKARQSARKKTPADEQLSRYRSMRDFRTTREPAGNPVTGKSEKAKDELPFVIQKHDATRLHYDFRLAWNGVLKSWAVTKGPSYFPGDKRLAVQVEDHPMEYGGFEGIIPKGQYGGGTVMVWDQGTWEPHVDPEEGLAKGSLKFSLHGEKMRGKWALVRMQGRAANESKPNWLLIKEHDALERGPQDVPVTEEMPDSVVTGRDIEAIAEAEDRVWTSSGEVAAVPKPAKRKLRTEPASSRVPARKKPLLDFSPELAKVPKEKLPEFIPPQLASPAKSPLRGDAWIHELKLDGYRIQAHLENGEVRLLTRTGLDWTHRMKPVAKAVAALRAKSAVLDGEVAVLAADGTTSFAALQAVFQEGAEDTLNYFAFDLLHLDGHNLRDLPLAERKNILSKLLDSPSSNATIRLSGHMTGDGATIFNKACELGAEGIVSKRAEGKYASGRGGDWAKLKCVREQELVIGGFTLPSNGIHGVGALILGYYRDGDLVYAGRSGTGFTQTTHRMMRDRLDKLRQKTPPFPTIPADARRGAQWVKPELVAQIAFSNWTADNLVRQAAFKGLREDKPARSVVREEPREDFSAAEEKHARKGAASQKTESIAAKRAVRPAESKSGNGLPIRLTHPDKVLDSASGLTKEALAQYYQSVARVMLPHIADRPLTLLRCVDGSDKPCFYQKHRNDMLPADIGSIDIVDKKTGKSEPYITLNSENALIELAQLGVLEVHPWGSRNESLEKPDRIVIDLDPDDAIQWETLADAAADVRSRLKALGLESFLKTTGGKGLHVVVPIEPEHPWPEVKQFAHDFVLAIEKEQPSLFLTRMTKAARKGKIYLDYLRNDRGSTAIAPFSPRARSGIPVALPLDWNELKASERPRYAVSDFQSWKSRLSRDPWKTLLTTKQHLSL